MGHIELDAIKRLAARAEKAEPEPTELECCFCSAQFSFPAATTFRQLRDALQDHACVSNLGMSALKLRGKIH